MTVESRMLTFKNTTRPFSQTPEALAAAGLYFTGPGDMVLCFLCQGGLSDWKENDNPWTEHCKWFPACAFAREIKGESFIQENQQELSASHSQEKSIPNDLDLRGRVEYLKSMGFSDDHTHIAVRHLNQKGNINPSIEDLIDCIVLFQGINIEIKCTVLCQFYIILIFVLWLPLIRRYA
ncbi:hypothetical protein DPMN_177451 [Dreissena polymorpha]|uniref:Uncharacterized protein n=1 Tax=Dreissena polymorpha TaxID=45954 RepID=A0A9D4EBP9_DREPO|nr:hypothetical protein DPMN_177451 [Dreissena polymorpha]